MQDIDRAFKTVLALKPDCVMNLLFGSQRQTVLKEITDPQINVPELRADKALVIEDCGKTCYLLCEAMIQPDRSELPTFALKALGMQYMLGKPVIVVIVYLEKGKYTAFPESFENRVGHLSNQFVLAKILLWEHEARILSGELKEFAPFLPLFYEQPDPGLMDVQQSLLAQISDPKLHADLIATAIVVDIRTWGTQLVLAKFAKEVNMLKETSVVQDWLTQSQQEGWQKGQQEGWQKGQQEGQKEGKFSLLQIILAQKLGTISPDLSSKLHQLSSEQLDRLGVALLNINSQQELQAWLSNGAAQELH
jgi:hypothetical protein